MLAHDPFNHDNNCEVIACDETLLPSIALLTIDMIAIDLL